MLAQTRFRLDTTIAAVCPISGTSGEQGSVRIDFAPGATAPQQTAANNALAAFDWSQAAQDAWENLQSRTGADAIVNGVTVDGKVMRAVAAVLVDEINNLRQWLAQFKAEVAAAASLADLKTRVATLPAMPDRTLAQAKTAILGKIDGGSVD